VGYIHGDSILVSAQLKIVAWGLPNCEWQEPDISDFSRIRRQNRWGEGGVKTLPFDQAAHTVEPDAEM